MWSLKIGRGIGLARYFFDISAPTRVADRVGMNLENLNQVKHEALRRAAEFASDIGNLETPGFILVTARDHAGDVVMNVRLVCVVEALGE